MTDRSPMHQQIDTLPALIRAIVKPFDAAARSAFDFETCTSVKRIYLVGCGDSHHAPVGAELAFNQLTGVPTQALSSLPFSRYTAGFLPGTGPKDQSRDRRLGLGQSQPHHRGAGDGQSGRRHYGRA